VDSTQLLNQIDAFVDQASTKAEEYSSTLSPIRDFIVSNFGQAGLIAFYLIVTVLTIVVITKLIGITLSALKYLIVPAVALAWLGSLVLPVSFVTTLPVTATACSLVLLFKE
jgi:hypothetical protein